jgi:regulator of protease activity HflC (stomatin/prohibitin superfamily)
MYLNWLYETIPELFVSESYWYSNSFFYFFQIFHKFFNIFHTISTYNHNRKNKNKQKINKKIKIMKKLIIASVIGVIAIVLLCCSIYTVKSTQRGILSTFGKMSEKVVEPGLHMKIPFVQTIQKVNVQQKKEDGKENSYTKDVQTSVVSYTINYDLVKDNVPSLIKDVGNDYHNKVVVPAIRTAMKDAFGDFAATEIVENRDKVRIQIESSLRETLDKRYFTNIQFTIADVDFDDDFETAIKEKQVAEQQALKAKNVTIQIEEKAKQTRISAEADAEAIRIKAKALESNPKLVEYEAVQKWDGKMPTYMMGNSMPLINLK